MTFGIVQVGVGADGIGVTWLRTLLASPDWRLAGVVDVSEEHRRVAAERAGLTPAQCFASIDEAARAVEVDAFAVVVSSPLHALLVRHALQADKHVIVEKPFTTAFDDARALADAAAGRGLRLMVDQNYRYLADILTLRKALAEDIVGPPEYVTLSFDCLWGGRPYQWEMADTNLLEMAVHHFDSLRFVLGSEPRTVWGHTWKPAWSRYRGDTIADCHIEFANGVRVAYHGSLESPGLRAPWQGLWRIECARGALHLGDLGSGHGVYVSHDPDRVEAIPLVGKGPLDPGTAIAATLREFAAALREGRRPQSDAQDNLRTLALAFGVSASATTGGPIDLERTFFPSAAE